MEINETTFQFYSQTRESNLCKLIIFSLSAFCAAAGFSLTSPTSRLCRLDLQVTLISGTEGPGLSLGCPIAHKWQHLFVRFKQEGRGIKSNEWFVTKGWDSCSHGKRHPLCCLKKGISKNEHFFIGSVGHDIDIWWEYIFSGNRTVAGRSFSIFSTHLVNTLKSQGSSP